MEQKTITVAYGDGIGPEIMDAVLRILQNAKAKLNFETIEIGEKIYNRGYSSGIGPDAWESVRKNGILLKAPITTPQGKGFKSLNVTFRKTLGLFANIRPCITYPFLSKSNKHMDMVIFRENEEDLYSGIEYRITKNTALCFKMITKQGSERIIRRAFEYAKNYGRRKVTCISKDNIMKITDGIFHNIFREVKDEYPDIEADHLIVDIASAKIAVYPELFDVIVTLNLYGDIISDIAAEVASSVGLAGSANIGDEFAMFEAIHGSAPDIANLNIANPSGLLNGALMMLEYIKHYETAELIRNAWLKTLEDGMHTQDIFEEGESAQLVSTSGFADAVIANLGESPKNSKETVRPEKSDDSKVKIKPFEHKEKLMGVDIYVNESGKEVVKFANEIKEIIKDFGVELQTISEKGLSIWPNIIFDKLQSEIPRLRFISKKTTLDMEEIIKLQQVLIKNKIMPCAIIPLKAYDDMAGFTKAQGEQ